MKILYLIRKSAFLFTVWLCGVMIDFPRFIRNSLFDLAIWIGGKNIE